MSGIFTGTTVPWLNRFYIHYTGTAPTNAQLATFDAAVNTAWGTNMKPLMPLSGTMTQIESADLTSSTGAVDTSPFSVAGTRAGTNLPADQCLVSSYEIARRYRGGHPRAYWYFGVVADQASPLVWSTTFTNSCNTGINAFFTALVAAGWTGAGTLTHVNVSYYEGFTVFTNPITGRARNVPTVRGTPLVDTVTSVASKTSIGSQRRRIAFVD